MLPTPRPPPTSVSRGRDWSVGSERAEPELGEAFLASGLFSDVKRRDDRASGSGYASAIRPTTEQQG